MQRVLGRLSPSLPNYCMETPTSHVTPVTTVQSVRQFDAIARHISYIHTAILCVVSEAKTTELSFYQK